LINKSVNIIDFCVGTVRNQETKFLPTGSPPLQSSTKGKLMRKRKRGPLKNKGRAWGLNTVFRFDGKRDADSI
jgi:hypothetical protein